MHPILFCSVMVVFTCLADRSMIPDDIQAKARSLVDDEWVAGIVVGVIDQGDHDFFCYGQARRDRPMPTTPTTVFEIGSITKAFTGVLLAEAERRGEVAAGDPIQRYLPTDVQLRTVDGKAITLLDLATHRSGLPRLPTNMDPNLADPYADYTTEKLHAFLRDYVPKRAPGEAYEYSNLGAGLLGNILAARAELTYDALVRERICTPLRLNDTRVIPTAEMQARMALGYEGNMAQPVANWAFDALAGCGALRSTASDLARFVSAASGLTKTPIAPALEKSVEKQQSADSERVGVALGWHILHRERGDIVWHNGGTAGYRSFCGFHRRTRRGVVVLTNASFGVDDIGLHYLDPTIPLDPVPKTVRLSREQLREYVGRYRMIVGAEFDITLRDRQLYAQLSNQPAFPIYPEALDRFFYRVVEAQLDFKRGDDGRIDHLILHQNGIDQPAQRLPEDDGQR